MYNLKQQDLFAENFFSGKITLNNADETQSNLLHKIIDFSKNTKPTGFSKKKQNKDTLDSLNAFYECREMVISF